MPIDRLNQGAAASLPRGATPKPWFEHNGNVRAGSTAFRAYSVALADTVYGTDEERVANARVFAAAPELLAACGSMLERFGDHEQYDETGEDTAAINETRAAIAKATGK